MSLHNLAKTVESKGRGKDTVLVHMTPNEVKGLQALAMAHGGSLSINPNTGLIEAGFLEKALPAIAAGALTYFTAGAAAPFVAGGLGVSTATGGLLAGAGIGALLGGGVSALQGGNFGRGALMGGLGGALGGYGAAGGFEGVMGSTAPTIDATTGAAIPGSADVATQVAAQQAPAGTLAGQQVAAMAPGAERTAALNALAEQQGVGVTSTAFGNAPAAGAEQAMFRAENLARPSEVGDIYQPFKQAQAPDAGLFGTGITGRQAALGLGGVGLVSSLMSDQQKYGVPEQEQYTSPLKRISPNFRGYEPERPRPYYKPTYAASGGVVALAQGGDFDDERGYDMAKGGISHLGDYSDGGRLLKGPGDGVSDDIPAQIGTRQPARLADGEFVVPARIVSEIGNGSTDAGARKLYAMMDRVQKARRKSVGKGKFAVDSRAEKLLPV